MVTRGCGKGVRECNSDAQPARDETASDLAEGEEVAEHGSGLYHIDTL